MLKEAPDLARYYDVPQTARCLGLPEARVRDWQRKDIVPALTKGRIQFSRTDVVRMFALDQLQSVFGQTAIATQIAQALQPAGLEGLLEGRLLKIEALVSSPDGVERTFRVDISPVAVERLRERMAEVPR
jgi:hypothetical protein